MGDNTSKLLANQSKTLIGILSSLFKFSLFSYKTERNSFSLLLSRSSIYICILCLVISSIFSVDNIFSAEYLFIYLSSLYSRVNIICSLESSIQYNHSFITTSWFKDN